MLLEHELNLPKPAILAGTPISLSEQQAAQLTDCITRLNNAEPIQYILGEAVFYGRKFSVNPSVLIPRPETEELAHVALGLFRTMPNPAILDIGTGSGCIAITIKLENPSATVFATDISHAAIAVAKENANRHQADIHFLQHNLLTAELPFSNLNLIISNPPYIAEAERDTLPQQVVDYEPHEALFAPDDPLIFYKAIAARGKQVLSPGGHIVVEINERFGQITTDVFLHHGYTHVQLINDLSAKNRIIVATAPFQ